MSSSVYLLFESNQKITYINIFCTEINCKNLKYLKKKTKTKFVHVYFHKSVDRWNCWKAKGIIFCVLHVLIYSSSDYSNDFIVTIDHLTPMSDIVWNDGQWFIVIIDMKATSSAISSIYYWNR